MATRHAVRKGGIMVSYEVPDEHPKGGDGAALIAPAAVKSPGALLLEELAPPKDFVYRKHVELPTKANDIWIRRLDHSEATGVGIRAIRDETGMCNLTSANHLTALKTAAFLMCCETEDGRPYFGDPMHEDSWGTAWAFAANKTDLGIKINMMLFEACTELNPVIVNRFGAEDAPEVADDSPLDETAS